MSTDANGAMYLWDGCSIHAKSLAFREEAHDLGVLTCDFSPIKVEIGQQGCVAHMVATGGNDDLIRFWAIQERSDSVQFVCQKVLSGHDGAVMHIRFSHAGDLLASGGGDKAILLWNAVRTLKTVTFTFSNPFNCAFHIQALGTRLKRLCHHERFVTHLAFASDDRTLFSVSNDKSLAVWRLRATLSDDHPYGPLVSNMPEVESLEHKTSRTTSGPNSQLHSIEAHASDVNQVVCLSTNSMASAGSDKFVKLWHRTGPDRPWSLTRSAKGHVYPIYSMDFHREKQLLISAGSDGVCLIWNSQVGLSILRVRLTTTDCKIQSVDFGSGGTIAIRCGYSSLRNFASW